MGSLNCSGHGAKHAAAMGEALVEQVLLGKSHIPVVELFGGMFAPKNNEVIQEKAAAKLSLVS